MAIRVNGSSASKAFVRVAGTWRPALAVWARTGGTWRKVYPYVPPSPPITGANISPTSQNWTRQGAGDFRASLTGSPVGGTGPFSYAWTVSGDGFVRSGQGTANVTVGSASGATVSVGLRIDDQGSGTSFSATARAVNEIPAPVPLVASVSPSSRVWSGSLGAFTAAFTGSGTGGSGSYGYAWSVSAGGTIQSGQGSPSVVVASSNGQAVTVTLTLSDTVSGTSTTASSSVAAVVWPALSASIAPSSLSGSSASTPVPSSGSATCTASGGSGSYSYAWQWDGGNTTGAISAVSPSSATTAFRSGNSQAAGTTRAQGMTCVVTDTVTGVTTTSLNSVVVTLSRTAAALVVSTTPSTLSGAGLSEPVETTGAATASVSGGSGSWTVAWVYDGTGTGGFNPIASTSATTRFRASPGQAQGQTLTGGYFPRVTDTVTGQTADGPAVAITLTRNYAPMAVSRSPSALSGASTSAPVATAGSVTASVSGGSGSFTFAWLYDGTGTGGFNPTAPTSATTGFATPGDQPAGNTRTGGFFPRVTDTVTGLTADGPAVSVTLTRNFTTMTASVAPSSLSGSSTGTPVTTSGTATCTASGGSGSYAYAWEWDGGNSTGAISAVSANSATTAFQSGSSQAVGTTRAQGMRCRVTDTVTGQVVVTNSVVVVLERIAALSVVITPPTQSWPFSPPYRVTTTATASGGTPPYTYGWDDTGPQPVPPGNYGGATKQWDSLSGRQSAFVTVNVTDALGATATASANITEEG